MLNRAKFIDKSGTITSGGTSQEVAAENRERNPGFVFQNTSDTDMRLRLGKPATSTTGFLVAANGGTWTMDAGTIFTDAIHVYCATSGKTFECGEA